MAITIIPSSRAHHGRPPKAQREHDQAVQDELTRIRSGVEKLSTKVDAIERLLVEVQ